MSVQVTVALGDDGSLVAVKRATTDAEVERLRAEAYRLRRAGHPGVVALVSHRRVPGGEELHLRYAGDPVERWRGTLAQAAGLGAAVAATLADLHDLGIVHGRVDATHVLVGSDGRPRLCGLSEPGDATAADDVAAVGRLVESLLPQAAAPRRGPFGLPLASSGDRRALTRAAARALDPEPSRRPSARTLATSILAAVHGAELPPRTGETPAIPATVQGTEPPPRTGKTPAMPAIVQGTEPPPRTGETPAIPATVQGTEPPPRTGETPAIPATVQGADPPPRTGETPAIPGAVGERSSSSAPTGSRPRRSPAPMSTPIPPGPPDPWPGPPPSVEAGPGVATDPRPVPGARPDRLDYPGEGPVATALSGTGPQAAVAKGAGADAEHRQRSSPDIGKAEVEVWAAVRGDATTSGDPTAGAGEATGADAGTSADAQAESDVGAEVVEDTWRIGTPGISREGPVGPVLSDTWPAEAGSALDAWLAWSVSAGLDTPLPRPGPRPDEPPAPAAGQSRSGTDLTTGPVPLPRLGDTGRRDRARMGDTDRGRAAGDDPLDPGDAGLATRAGTDEADDGVWEWSPRRLRAPDSDEVSGSRRSRRVLAGAAAAGVVGVALAAGTLVVTAPQGTEPTAARTCPRAPAPAADVDGDGCAEALAVRGNEVRSGDATWQLGRPGDVVAVGDWDCDGAATSALLRPGTGDVFLFAGWSADGEPVTVTPTRSVPGGVRLQADPRPDGCDALVVESADGARTVVDEARA